MPNSTPASQRNGRVLDQLHDIARRLQAGSGGPTPEQIEQHSPLALCAELGLDEGTKLRAIAEATGVSFVETLADYSPSAEFTARVPIGFARQHVVLGLAREGDRLKLAVGALESLKQLDVIGRILKCAVEPLLAPRGQVLAAINTAYQDRSGQAQQVIEALDRDQVLKQLKEAPQREDLLDTSGRAPVIKLINMILFEAVKNLASDIHIQPYEERLVVRIRIDGMLFDALEIPKDLQEEAISRVKVMGRMDIAEKRLPQDGRATVQVGDRLIDLRIASLPTSHGERVVIRLLDKSARIYTLGELGMEPKILEQFRELIHLEHGLTLVTGPTGAGKSTTLYAALLEIDAKDRNIVTLEDPIEYQLEGISQTQINAKKGLTFARGLRNVLRQDPDIIMVGEVRDQETAVMAIQSALTGHMVFSTLHTNDAASAVTRLLDLKVEPYLVASSVVAVLAQRLVRHICRECLEFYEPSSFDLARLGVSPADAGGKKLARGCGCSRCRQTGYRGRVGIFELLVVDEPIREQVQQQANASQIVSVAASRGMKRLHDDGIRKAFEGVTTVDEVMRVTTRATA